MEQRGYCYTVYCEINLLRNNKNRVNIFNFIHHKVAIKNNDK